MIRALFYQISATEIMRGEKRQHKTLLISICHTAAYKFSILIMPPS